MQRGLRLALLLAAVVSVAMLLGDGPPWPW
jgi:hypothetical protein